MSTNAWSREVILSHADKLTHGLNNLGRLKDVIKRVLGGDRYSHRVDLDPEYPNDLVILATIEDVTQDLGFFVGDVIQSFRSSLDYVVFEMACKHTIPLTEGLARKCQFPIIGDVSSKGISGKGPEMFSTAAGKDLSSVPADARAVIQSLQPYHRGDLFVDDPLWCLAELSNIDKHRTIHVVTAYTRDIIYYAPKGKGTATIGSKTGPVYGPKGETEVARITLPRPATLQDAVDMKIQCAPSIAFKGGPVTDHDVPQYLDLMWLYLKLDVFPKFRNFL